jgi:hypothetical protein
MVENSTYRRGFLKERLYEEGFKERRCEECGQGEIWRGRRMSLILDHINGVGDDHRLDNLRIICPNCAATLDTHCGRNLPRERECAGCGKAFAPKNVRHRYCTLACFNRHRGTPRYRISKASAYGKPRPAMRKVTRPPYERLMREIEQNGYRATGRTYGVSDNAIRKWVRSYENEFKRRRKGDE